MTRLVLTQLTFDVAGQEVEVESKMAVYVGQQISYFLMEKFGIKCDYKVEVKQEAKK